jgi:hypothetical protein
LGLENEEQRTCTIQRDDLQRSLSPPHMRASCRQHLHVLSNAVTYSRQELRARPIEMHLRLRTIGRRNQRKKTACGVSMPPLSISRPSFAPFHIWSVCMAAPIADEDPILERRRGGVRPFLVLLTEGPAANLSCSVRAVSSAAQHDLQCWHIHEHKSAEVGG